MDFIIVNPNTGLSENFVYQWDTNVTLYVDIKNVVEAEAVFSNQNAPIGKRISLTHTNKGWMCIIPSFLINEGLDIFVYIAYTDANSRKTVGSFVIPVHAQTRPEGFITENDSEFIDVNAIYSEIKQMYNEIVDIANTLRESVNTIRIMQDEIDQLRKAIGGDVNMDSAEDKLW